MPSASDRQKAAGPTLCSPSVFALFLFIVFLFLRGLCVCVVVSASGVGLFGGRVLVFQRENPPFARVGRRGG